MSKAYIGTSGFSYSHWGDGIFYPKDLPQKDWFLYYAKYFDTVELNVSFYRLPKKEVFAGWRKKAGPDFVFSVKGSRFITHIKKLKDCYEPVERFFEAVNGLSVLRSPAESFDSASDSLAKNHSLLNEVIGARKVKPHKIWRAPRTPEIPSPPLSVVLWQLPPGWGVDSPRLELFLKILPKTFRHAFELRNPTWLTGDVYRLLKKADAAVVFQDYPNWPITQEITADFVYLRFHGKTSLYSSCYTEKELKEWAEKIRKWIEEGLDVYGYFNNDALGYAIENAKQLKELI